MKWAKIFSPELILELWYLLLHPGLPSVSGGIMFGSSTWSVVTVASTAEHAAPAGKKIRVVWVYFSNFLKEKIKKGLFTLKYLFLALVLLLLPAPTIWI